MCYNATDDEIYAVNAACNFVRIGRDGSQTQIMTVNIPKINISVSGALMYSPKDGKYLFQGLGHDYSAVFYWIDPQAKTCEQAAILPQPAYYTCLISGDDVYAADVPGYGKFVDPDFPNSLQPKGKLSYELPKTTLGGDALSSQLDYTVKLDDNVVASGKAAPGEKVTLEITAPQRGYYRISAFASIGDKQGTPTAMWTFIGNDKPKNPEYVTLNPSNGKLTWQAPTNFVHGGVIDQAGLTYNVFMNGRMQNPYVKDTQYQLNINSEGAYNTYWASVKASCLQQQSDEVSTDTLFIGKYLEIPFSLRPEKWEARAFSKNSNRLDTWQHQNRDVRPYFWSQEVNDILRMPVIRVPEAQAGKTFRLCYDAAATGDDEFIQVRISDDFNFLENCRPVSYNNRINKTENHDLEDEDFKSYETFFSVPAAGDYYISFKHDGEKRDGYLYLSNMSLEVVDSLDMSVPGYVNVLETNTLHDKDMKIAVNFMMPNYLLNGQEINASETLKAVVRNGDKTATVEGKPNARVSLEIGGFEGENAVAVYVERGGKKGAESVSYAYCGSDIPTDVTNFSYKYGESPYEMTFYWDKPTEKGFNGRYVNPDEVEYYFAHSESTFWSWFDVDLDNLPEDKSLIKLTPENGLKRDGNGRYSWTWKA